MKIKLRNGKLTIDGYEKTKDVKVVYNYELGTNHLRPLLIINDGSTNVQYDGRDPVIDMNFDCESTLNFTVKLYDAYNHVVKTYINTFKYLSFYSLNDRMDYVDVYKENEELKAKIAKLEEKGEVI